MFAAIGVSSLFKGLRIYYTYILCSYSSKYWNIIFSVFKVVWVFDGSLSSNVFQLLRRPLLPKTPNLIWVNTAKALLAKIWFERNQRTFHDKERGWFDIVDTSKRNTATCCSLNAEFKDYSIQDICLNWTAFIQHSP